jgi:hypothetical protein
LVLQQGWLLDQRWHALLPQALAVAARQNNPLLSRRWLATPGLLFQYVTHHVILLFFK